MRLTVVGCAGSFAGPDAPTSSYLLQAPAAGTDGAPDVAEDSGADTGADTGGTPSAGGVSSVVMDLGSGALGALQRYLDLPALDAVLLSHMHADHFVDLCGLYVARRYDPAGPAPQRLPVRGPSNALARLAEAYGDDGHGRMEHVYDVTPWVEGEPVAVGPFSVTPRRVAHPVEAWGMRVEHAGRVLAYSGDTDTCDALVDLARDADVFLAEASFQEGRDDARGVHLTGRRAGEVATAAGARRLVLTHVPPWTDAAIVLAEAKAAYDGPVEVAAPGLVVEV